MSQRIPRKIVPFPRVSRGIEQAFEEVREAKANAVLIVYRTGAGSWNFTWDFPVEPATELASILGVLDQMHSDLIVQAEQVPDNEAEP